MSLSPALARSRARHARPRRLGTATVTAGATALLALQLAGAPAASAGDVFQEQLYKLRMCESGGNYAINTGNGYYGAYQFDLGTWRAVGGTGYPHQNSPAVQDEMTTRLYEQRGWSPWPSCSRSQNLQNVPATRPNAGSNPVGHVDAVSPGTGAISVRGWAFDRDNDPSPIQVHAYVDGKGALAMNADQSRPDVANAFGVGASHGFSGRFAASPGAHHVCLYGINAGGGGNVLLGCYDVTVDRSPIGNVDSVRAVPGGVRVTGWTLDLDTPAQTSRAHVYVDGQGAANVAANRSRPDVARAYGVPEARGYDVVVPSGRQICGFAIDTTGQAPNTLLKCASPAA